MSCAKFVLRQPRSLASFRTACSATFSPLPPPTLPSTEEKQRIGQLFSSRSASSFLKDAELTHFEHHGYVTCPEAALSLDQLNALRNGVYSAFNGELTTQSSPYEYDLWHGAVTTYLSEAQQQQEQQQKGEQRVLKINNSWWINDTIQQFLLSDHFANTIGQAAADLLGTSEIRLWHDQAIIKPGGGHSSGTIGWHQDYAYWTIASDPSMITALIMLQDTDEKNGTLQTVAGSHRFGLVQQSCDPGFFQHDLETTKEKLRELSGGKPWEIVANPVSAGQVMFHHGLTMHASGPNYSATPRLAIAVHMQDATRVRLARGKNNGCHHNLRDLGPFATEGMPFRGPQFPVLNAKSTERKK